MLKYVIGIVILYMFSRCKMCSQRRYSDIVICAYNKGGGGKGVVEVVVGIVGDCIVMFVKLIWEVLLGKEGGNVNEEILRLIKFVMLFMRNIFLIVSLIYNGVSVLICEECLVKVEAIAISEW